MQKKFGKHPESEIKLQGDTFLTRLNQDVMRRTTFHEVLQNRHDSNMLLTASQKYQDVSFNQNDLLRTATNPIPLSPITKKGVKIEDTNLLKVKDMIQKAKFELKGVQNLTEDQLL